MKKVIIFFVILSASNYCSYSQLTTKIDKEKIKSEISLVEQNFQKDLVTSGVDFAFHKYAAENAVIKREKDRLVIGKQAIKIITPIPSIKMLLLNGAPTLLMYLMTAPWLIRMESTDGILKTSKERLLNTRVFFIQFGREWLTLHGNTFGINAPK
jgi:hypothetical protein